MKSPPKISGTMVGNGFVLESRSGRCMHIMHVKARHPHDHATMSTYQHDMLTGRMSSKYGSEF